MMLRFLIACFLWIPVFAHAQENDSLRSQYVRDFPDYFNVKLIATDRLLILDMIGKDEDQSNINYAPNDRGYIGIGTYIFDLGIEVSVKVPVAFQRSISKYGDTDFIDFQGNLYGRRWCVDATFQKYDGFYISNAVDIFPEFSAEENFPQRSDLSVMNIMLNGIHIFNHEKFSFRSGFIHADRQIKSAGSPLLLLSTNYFRIKADSVLVPENIANSFGKAEEFSGGSFSTFSVLPGYAYNFAFSNFYINLNVTGGAGIQYQKFDVDSEKRQWAIEPKVNFRAAVGYDNDRFFAGGSFMMQRSNINIDGLRINNTAGNYKIFVGYRFKKFGILKKYSIRDIKPLDKLF